MFPFPFIFYDFYRFLTMEINQPFLCTSSSTILTPTRGEGFSSFLKLVNHPFHTLLVFHPVKYILNSRFRGTQSHGFLQLRIADICMYKYIQHSHTYIYIYIYIYICMYRRVRYTPYILVTIYDITRTIDKEIPV